MAATSRRTKGLIGPWWNPVARGQLTPPTTFVSRVEREAFLSRQLREELNVPWQEPRDNKVWDEPLDPAEW